MDYFEEIIFLPSQKVKLLSSSTPFVDSYYFDFTIDGIKFMVKCPKCGTKYKYSTIKSYDTVANICQDIDDLADFFISEWIMNCPNKSFHLSGVTK